MLDQKGFAVVVPQHAMTLHSPELLVLTLSLLDQSLWLASAKDTFEHTDDLGKKAIIFLCFFEQSDECDAFLSTVANSANNSADVQKDAQQYLAIEKDALKTKVPVTGTMGEIRERRNQRLHAISDEAMSDAQEMTLRMIQLRHR